MSANQPSQRLSQTSRCTRCQERWKQSKDGLCRRCMRQLGIDETQQERDRRHVEKQAERLAVSQSRLRPPNEREMHAMLMRRPRAIVVHPTIGNADLDYFVIWAGDMDGARSMGLPLGSEKRASYTGRQERWSPQQKGSGLRRGDFGDD